MITVNRRHFNTKEEADQYRAGYRSYPRWPQNGVNGSRVDVDTGSIEAMGWYDADEEQQHRMDRMSGDK